MARFFRIESTDGETWTASRADMLRDNDGDDDVCGWVRGAHVGDVRDFGGGAAPTWRITAVRS